MLGYIKLCWGEGGQHVEITLSESPAECWVILNCVGGWGGGGMLKLHCLKAQLSVGLY